MKTIIAALAAVAAAVLAVSVAASSPGVISSSDYGSVLKAYVNDNGMVNYQALKRDRARLDAFTASLAGLEAGDYEKLSEQEKIALWINAYNALTLTAIIDHYPIKSSFTTSLFYPDNSIRQISGVWDELPWTVMGKSMTLDDIEHRTLREKFNEPRIHLALVCAAMGCPPLRNEPYSGVRLGAQLDDQAKKFLANPKKFRIDRAANVVHLSSIFKWFGDDFISSYGTDDKFAGHDQSERAVLNFISRHLDAGGRDYLLKQEYSIKYLDYDWTLNEN